MKIILTLILAMLITGCATRPVKEPQILVKYKYVVTSIPSEMLEIPVPVRELDLSTATDQDAARWIISSEKRSLELEAKLKAIKSYLVDRLKNLSIPPEDLINY